MLKINTIKSIRKWTIHDVTFPNTFKVFGSDDSKVIFCEADDWKTFYETNQSHITDLELKWTVVILLFL